jgi:hypothetical protein
VTDTPDPRRLHIRELGARLTNLPANRDHIGLLGILAGALHALDQAVALGYSDLRGVTRDLPAFEHEFRAALKAIAEGSTPPQTWLSGFYFVDALFRLSVLHDRLRQRFPTSGIPAESPVERDVGRIKHGPVAHPVANLEMTLDSALADADAMCTILESGLRGTAKTA